MSSVRISKCQNWCILCTLIFISQFIWRKNRYSCYYHFLFSK